MSFYQVDSRVLRTKKEELLNMVSMFRKEKEELCQKEAALRSMWEGEANENFHNAFVRNAGQMEAFLGTIMRYVNVIETIADRYDAAEQRNIGRAM